MSRKKQDDRWWTVPLFLLLLPLIIVVLILWALYSLGLYLLVWACWVTRGRDILFVYSDSPHWKDFVEQELLPRIQYRAVILNWSERRRWLGKMALGPMLFRSFGGHREFNPIALHFRPLRFHRTYRFWEPIRKWKKQDDRNDLDTLLNRFYADIKI